MTPTDIKSIVATGALYSREVVPGIVPIEVGREVRALPYSPEGHTRLPNYIRKKGTITELRGTFVFPDTLAHGLGECDSRCILLDLVRRNYGLVAIQLMTRYISIMAQLFGGMRCLIIMKRLPIHI